MKSLKLLRPAVDRVPLVADLYRLLRDFLVHRRATPRLTPQGFSLAGNRQMQVGLFEPQETKLVSDLLASVDVFVDIGANVGYYTCLARNLGCSVLAVEPGPGTLRYLYSNLLANGFEDVEVAPVGLGSTIGLRRLFGSGGGASTTKNWKSNRRVPTCVIPTTTLDRLLSHRYIEQRLFIKIDVEGAEFDVLDAGHDTLRRVPPPVWLVEIYLDRGRSGRNPRFRDTFELFWSAGYGAVHADRDREPVTEALVDAWIAGGETPATANFLFRSPSTR